MRNITLIFILVLMANSSFSFAQISEKDIKESKKTYNKALEFIVDKDYFSALEVLDKSIEFSHQNTDALILRGKVNVELGIFADALNDFKTALNINENLGEAWFFTGYLLFNKNPDGAVLEMFDKAVLKGYKSPEVYYYRGCS